jgi:hypothetical protein
MLQFAVYVLVYDRQCSHTQSSDPGHNMHTAFTLSVIKLPATNEIIEFKGEHSMLWLLF